MANVLYIFAGLMFAIVVAILGFFIYNKVQENKKPENEIILEHYMPQYSEGHTDGLITDMEIGEKRTKITFSPRDINYIKELNNNKTIKSKKYTLYFDNKQIEVTPISTHRHKMKAYPGDISLLPEQFKKTNFGKAIMNIIQNNNQLKDESQLMQQRMESLQNIASKNFGGEIFSEYSEMVNTILKDKSDLTKKEERTFTPNKT